MPSKITVIVSQDGVVQVLSSDPAVQVLVLKAAEHPAPTLNIPGFGDCSIHGIAQGLPQFQPDTVHELFSRVVPMLPSAGAGLPLVDHTRLTLAAERWAQA